jgi:hypothetical protein
MIRRCDVAWVALWAAGTVGAAGLLWGPGETIATDVAVDQPVPMLQLDGVQVRAEPAAAFEAGEPARVRLIASNPSKADVTTRVRVRFTSLAPASPMSRRPSFPQSFYDREHDLIVQAGKTVELELASETPTPPGSIAATLMPAKPAAQQPQQSAAQAGQPLSDAVVLTTLAPPGAVEFPLGASAVPGAAPQGLR